MDIIGTVTVTGTNTSSPFIAPEVDTETITPPRIQAIKPISITNGVLKRHHPLHEQQSPNNHPPAVVTYKECLKNHAACLGRHAVDGCGEFMPSPNSNPTDPTSLKCAACGCHRNFHRREPEDPLLPPNTTTAIEYQPHHRHHPPPPAPPSHGGGGIGSSPNSPSPPPISSSYYPSAPHMLLALSAAVQGHTPESNPPVVTNAVALASHPHSRKRHRTKFTQNQKDRMHEFAERVGWKMQKRDEELIAELCGEIGVDRGVLKVWMHNNKNTQGKKDHADGNNNGIGSKINLDSATPTVQYHQQHNKDDEDDDDDINATSTPAPNNTDDSRHQHHLLNIVSVHAVATNGSSSS